IAVNSITAAASQAGFVTEAAPIPVIQPTTAALLLAPRKFAMIVPFSRDIFQHSTPIIQAIVRDGLSRAVAAQPDSALLDNVAGDGTRPPGLRNGISGTTASALTVDSEAMYDDLSTLIAAVAPVSGSAPVAIVAAPKQAEAITLRRPEL